MALSLPIAIGGILALVVLSAAAWWFDRMRIETAARMIDQSYQTLARPPRWSPDLPLAQIPAPVVAQLDQWDQHCHRDLGLVPLGRLAEYSGDDLLGLRTVLLDSTGTIAATLACSHRNPAVSFRSLASRVGGQFVLTTDAKSPSSSPQSVVLRSFDKVAPDADLLAAHRGALESAGPAAPFASLADYVDFQVALWQAGHAHRTEQGYLIDRESLRRLAPAGMAEARLERVHAAIVALHRNRPRST